jgi:hypothetical protein
MPPAFPIFAALLLVAAAEPGTGDPELDFLLGRATASPATSRPVIPTTRPVPVTQAANPEARPGTVRLSDGTVLAGQVSTTREKPLRVWDAAEKEYRDIPLTDIRTIVASILWERLEPEWRFRDSGSDIKEYTGRSYPARELEYELTLRDGTVLRGGLVAPLYIERDGGTQMHALNKRQKGEVGHNLADLVYVARVDLE